MSKDIGIKAGDFIECEGCMYSDYKAGYSYEVHEDENGLYMIGGPGNKDKYKLTECYTFTKELTGDVYAMCLGASFIKRADKESKASIDETVKVALPTFEFRADNFTIENKASGVSISYPTPKEKFVYRVERWLDTVGHGYSTEKVSEIVVKDDKDALLKIQRFVLNSEVSSDEEFKVLVDCEWRRDNWEDEVLSSSLEDLLVGKISRSGLSEYNFWSVYKVKLV